MYRGYYSYGDEDNGENSQINIEEDEQTAEITNEEERDKEEGERDKEEGESLKHKAARFYVLGISDDLIFEEGSAFVYGDYLLARTQHFLPDVMRLPDDISPLVQKVYNSGELIEFSNDELEQKYLDAEMEHHRKITEKETKANI